MLKNRLFFIFIIFFSLAVTYYCQQSGIFNQYAFNGDLRGNIYWMQRARNPELFKDDLLAEFSEHFANPFLRLIYRTFTYFSPALLAKLLAFPLCLIAAIYMFKLGTRINGSYCGFFASILFVLSAWYRSNFEFFGVGNAGDFFSSLGVIFLYYFFIQSMLGMSALLILQAFIYPPVFLISIGCFTISAFQKFNLRNLSLWLIVIGISSFILFTSYNGTQSKQFGETYTYKEITQMEEFKQNGRIPLIYPDLFSRIFNNRSGIGEITGRTGLLIFLAMVCSIFSFKRMKCLWPKEVVFFLFSSFLLFLLANLLMLRLFEPARYLLLSLPLALIIVISSFISKVIHLIAHQRYRIISLVLLFIGLCSLFSLKVEPNNFLVDDNVKFYEFLRGLPDESLIAGHPYWMDNIPLLAQKKVLINQELSCPYFKKYYRQIQQRTYDFFKAYYTDSRKVFEKFCREYNIDYFVVKKNDFTAGFLQAKNFYFSPYNQFVIELTNEKEGFLLIEYSLFNVVYEDEAFIVIKTGL